MIVYTAKGTLCIFPLHLHSLNDFRICIIIIVVFSRGVGVQFSWR